MPDKRISVSDGSVDLRGEVFEGDVAFTGTVFTGPVRLEGARFLGNVDFSGTTWTTTVDTGAFAVAGTCSFFDATFQQRARITALTRAVDFWGTRFAGGAWLRFRWADVRLGNVMFDAPSLLVSATNPFEQVDEDFDLVGPWRDRGLRPMPRLLSLRGTDLSQLTIASFDLTECRFLRAHNLDQLRVEGTCLWGATPRGWRWTRRRTVVEEHVWRGWRPAEAGTRVPTPVEIASEYRSLRKAVEDTRDQPGAADFYYGEMTMRRHDKPDLLLTLYWLVSGYGLRAWRALTAFTACVLAAALALWLCGLVEPRDLQTGLLASLRSAIGPLRGPDAAYTTGGQWIDVGLRLAGPLLLGLALLSLRGRVKR